MAAETFAELAALRIEVAPEARSIHLDAIHSALGEPAQPHRRRRIAAIASVVAALSLPAAAIAAESSIPGDSLYPVKKALEPIRRIVDDSVVARHRVEELSLMIERRLEISAIERHVNTARAAVADVNDPGLESELEALLALIPGDQTTDDEPTSTQDDTGVTDVSTTTLPPPITDAPLSRDTSPPEPDTTSPPSDRPEDTVDPPPSDRPAPTDRPPATDPPPSDGAGGDAPPSDTAAPVGDRDG